MYDPASVGGLGRHRDGPCNAADAAPLIGATANVEDTLALVDWQAGLSAFHGRDQELAALLAWARAGPVVSARFVIGGGGAGKPRLAAELARILVDDHAWRAAFVDLGATAGLRLHSAGTLLIVDDPEAHRDGVAGLLRDLAGIDGPAPIRVLILSRLPFEPWQATVEAAGAGHLFHDGPLSLDPIGADGRLDADLAADAAWRIFGSARARCPTSTHDAASPANRGDFMDWLEGGRERRWPLVLVAAAVHAARWPDAVTFTLESRDLVATLVRDELRRLRRLAAAEGWTDDRGPERLVAIAAVAGGLGVERIAALGADASLGLPADGCVAALADAGLMVDGRLPRPRPDVLAAALVVEVFAAEPERAPEWLWAAVIRARKTVLDGDLNDGRRAELLHELAVDQANGGSPEAALAPIGNAVALRRRRAGDDPDQGLADLASSLNLQSFALAAVGDAKQALVCAREVLRLRRRLAEKDGDRHGGSLADGLSNLSHLLAATGEPFAALSAAEEAVAIRRRLARTAPSRLGPDLAEGLATLALRLSASGDLVGALAAGHEAVALRRRLVPSDPARHEPALAANLMQLSRDLTAARAGARAAVCVREAAAIFRHLADIEPDRFEPALASGLNALSNRLAAIGDHDGALDVAREAVALQRRLARLQPDRHEPELAGALNNLSNRLARTGDIPGALKAVCEATTLYAKLARVHPRRFEPAFATTLGTMGTHLRGAGHGDVARAAFRKGIRVIEPHASRVPAGPARRLLIRLRIDLETLSAAP